MKRIGWALTCLLICSGCARTSANLGPMTVRVLQGAAQILRDGKAAERISSQSAVKVGDEIKVSGQGVAELKLQTGRSFELQGADVSVVSTNELVLSSGDLLASLLASAKVRIESAQISADKGVFRVDRSLASRVGVYRNHLTVEGGGDSLVVPELRQAIIAGGIIPSAPQPLKLNPDDKWDRRFLESVIDLDARLTNFGRGLEAQLGEVSGLDFFGGVAPLGTDINFLTGYIDNRRSDLLIGLMIAVQSAGSSVPLAQRFSEIFSLWKQDSSWGLIAYQFGVSENNLFSLLVDAIGKAGLVVVGPGPGPGLRPRRTRSPSPKITTSPSTKVSPTKSSTSPSPHKSQINNVPSPVASQVPSGVGDVICGLIGSSGCS